jgi:cytochrome b6-f complex iron-sulfur subunit
LGIAACYDYHIKRHFFRESFVIVHRNYEPINSTFSTIMNRREFTKKACLGGVGLIVGSAVISSLGIPTIKATPRTGVFHGYREIPLVLADTPELQAVGGAYHLEIDEIDKHILVVRTGETEFVAVDIQCTHKGCDVKYEEKAKMFVCPCHDSHFDLKGEPKSGPAQRPLGSYKTTYSNGEVNVYIPAEGEPASPNDSSARGADSTIKK